MKSILHVDDDIHDLELIKLQLARLSGELQIAWAESAELALAALEEGMFDCVLCDYQMPGMNGLQLLRNLREGREGCR